MDESKRDDRKPSDEVKLPEERIEDLEPEEQDSEDVKGGASTDKSSPILF